MSWRLVNEFRGLPWRDFAREAWHPTFTVAKFLCFLHVTNNHVTSFVLPVGPSMLPTFNISGDVLLADKLSTKFGKIKRGDLVLVRSPQIPMRTVCKRVIGMEGDCVEFYKTEDGEQNQHVIVPKGHIWVQGDNLSVSNDSRNYGPVPCALIEGKLFLRVLIANIGDAKAVLARSTTNNEDQKTLKNSSGPLKAIVVTREHKAIYPQERARIQKAGGYVGANGRLQGRLEVSRAFGDRQFKKVGVSAIPDVHTFELTERENFMILGCDGLWGVFGPSDAVEFVARQLKEGSSTTVACRRLLREAIRERRCKDNCTAILLVFKHQESLQGTTQNQSLASM